MIRLYHAYECDAPHETRASANVNVTSSLARVCHCPNKSRAATSESCSRPARRAARTRAYLHHIHITSMNVCSEFAPARTTADRSSVRAPLTWRACSTSGCHGQAPRAGVIEASYSDGYVFFQETLLLSHVFYPYTCAPTFSLAHTSFWRPVYLASNFSDVSAHSIWRVRVRRQRATATGGGGSVSVTRV